KEHIIEANRELNIGWCMVDTKIVEKALPALNEIGVSSITFIYCKRSQRNFKLDFKRLEKILINSSQQSGRDNLMNLNILNSLEEFIKIYPDAKILNFSKNQIKENIKSIVIGCEGGFSSDEINLFNKEDIVGFKTSQILKSQTAVCAVASKILL
ncbi:MAG: RsmE family RNA methyltransferase, partial [Epsilonproteobacteria bacterium]|nr:RsmE family RNA methyltransferase [Campylobacterota bacterium]